jgi:hypothetical protein
MANIRELLIGLGKAKQTDISTGNVLAGIWRLNKLNAALCNPKLVTENDAQELGKGHEFTTQVFKSNWEVATTLEKYLSSEIAAWAFAFCLGKVVKSGTAPALTYTCTPLSPTADGTELPYFSMVEQIRPGGSAIIDRMHVGMAIKGFKISIGSGPGRANSKITIDVVGSGKLVEPSMITLPAATPEHLLPAGSLTCSINGVDYVTARNLVSVETGWDNNFRNTGYFPGSGTQDGAQIQGRMEIGDRVPSLTFVARYDAGSTELTKLKALTTGTAVIGLTADANNGMTVTWQQVAFEVAEIGETEGIVTVSVTCAPQYHATNGVISAVVNTSVDGICQ